jgi:hypothetical protein
MRCQVRAIAAAQCYPIVFTAFLEDPQTGRRRSRQPPTIRTNQQEENEMTTPADRAERAKVDRWIADWNVKQILAYNEQVKRREEQYKKCEERERSEDDSFTYPEHMKKWDAEFDFGEHIRRRFPVGMFLDSIEEDRDGDWRPSVKQLMRVAETGKELFYAAIGHIDATEEFLDEARGQFGPLVDAALEVMNESIERRDPVTGEFTIHVWPPERPARRT